MVLTISIKRQLPVNPKGQKLIILVTKSLTHFKRVYHYSNTSSSTTQFTYKFYEYDDLTRGLSEKPKYGLKVVNTFSYKYRGVDISHHVE